MAALLLSASFFLTGCGDPADGAAGLPGGQGSDGNSAPLSLNGPWDAETLQKTIDQYEGNTAGLFIGNLVVTGGGVVDFGTVKAHVVTALGTDADNSTGAAVLNLLAANVTFADGAKVALGHADDVAVLTTAQLANKGTTGNYATAVAGPSDYANLGGVTAVQNLTLSQAGTIASNLKVYVYGTFTVDGPVLAGVSGKIIAIKDVAVKGTTGDVSDDTKVDVSMAQISVENHTGAATVKLPTAFDGRFALSGGELTITEDTTDLTAYMLPGNGVLKLADATTTVHITGFGRIAYPGTSAGIAFVTGSSIVTGGSGYVSFAKGIAPAEALTLGGPVAIATGENITIGTSGAVTLNAGSTVYAGATPVDGNEILTADSEVVLSGDAAVLTVTASTQQANQKLDVSDATLAVAGDVSFGGDLTLTEVGATFANVATFAHGAVVTLTDTTSIITLGTNTGAIAVGEGRFPYNAIFQNVHASNPATLTPLANTTLTFDPTGRTVTQGAVATAVHGIEIDKELTMPSGATYAVDAKGTLKVDTSAVLTLGAGVLEPPHPSNETTAATRSSLVLTGADTTGAKLTGDGKVVAGDTEIIGGTNGWQATVADTSIAIEAGAITGTGTNATLAAVTGGGQAITQLAVEDNNLTIAANTIIDLGTDSGNNVGTIALTQAQLAAHPAQLTLTDATSVILANGGTAGEALTATAGLFATSAADNKLLCSDLSTTTGVAVYKGTDGNAAKLCKITGGNAPSTLSATANSASGTDPVVIGAASAVS
jgi:hypothetical protein